MNEAEIYGSIPPMLCRPLCGECCGLVPWSKAEWARVADRAPARLTLHDVDGSIVPQDRGSMNCPFLSAEAACTVYNDRPFMCRLFGTAPLPRLVCPYGCKPETPLTREKATHLTTLHIRAARHADK